MYSKFDITTAKYGEVLEMKRYDLAILPWGSTEPHNKHLPYCTDMLMAQAVAFEVAEKAHEQGINAMVLPGIPLGSQNPGQFELPYCIHATQQTQSMVLRDIVVSLRQQGIRKLLIFNGHGGNIFKGIIRDLMLQYPEMLIGVSEWFAFVPRNEFFDETEDDHAGEQETSTMLYYFPDLVRMELAGDGSSKPFAIEGLNKKVGWVPRDWAKTTQDTGVGFPKKATAEKGKKYMEAVIPKLVQLVVDLVKKEVY